MHVLLISMHGHAVVVSLTIMHYLYPWPELNIVLTGFGQTSS